MKLKEALQKAFEAGENYCNSGEFAYYAPTFEKWYNEQESEFKNLNMPDVNVERELMAVGAVCPHFKTCQNGGKNEYCDLQTFKEIDCFVGADERINDNDIEYVRLDITNTSEQLEHDAVLVGETKCSELVCDHDWQLQTDSGCMYEKCKKCGEER